jgi:hypothetical protein
MPAPEVRPQRLDRKVLSPGERGHREAIPSNRRISRADLREYCEKAYTQKKCNFTCMGSRVSWEYIFLSEDKRFFHLDAYFGMHRCRSFPLNIFVPQCTDERNQ